ncbi:endonuclease domain-containing 1 protein-like [Clytia hemisphaerica]
MLISMILISMIIKDEIVFSKVVQSFESEPYCTDHFYRGIEPKFIQKPSYRRICQTKESINTRKLFYATLYDTKLKIPVYSAYTLEIGASQKRPKWMVEPQLENKTLGDDMVTSRSVNRLYEFKTQASDQDYKAYGKINFLTRGHLNPNAYHDGRERIATFSLTNIVPQYDKFNSGSWNKAESAVKEIMAKYCFGNQEQRTLPYVKKYVNAEAYFITGAIPSDHPSDVIGRNVTIPKMSFTAVCCTDPVRQKKFSFGFYGYNVRDTRLQGTRAVDLFELQDLLNKEWPGNKKNGAQDVWFFEDGCGAEDGLIYVNTMNRKLNGNRKFRGRY